MKHICDGMEYSTTRDRDLIQARNNYGTLVCTATKSACGEYWFFEDGDNENNAVQLHENALTETGYTVEQQLVRWYSSLD